MSNMAMKVISQCIGLYLVSISITELRASLLAFMGMHFYP